MKRKSEIIVNGLKPTNLVEKSYPLLMMKQVPFSLGELKILDTYLSRINARNVESRTVSFSKAEYESLMGIERMRPERLAKYVDSMMGKIVTLPEGNGWRKYVLFTSSRCYKREDNDEWWIDITCSPEAKKFFFNIEGIGYLKYQLKNTLSLKSVNSLLLYWYLRANVFRGKWSVDITELRESVFRCLDECYKDFKYFRRDILEKSLNDINEKTDLSFSFSVERKNRRAEKICFEILRDDSPLQAVIYDRAKQDAPNLMTTNLAAMLQTVTGKFNSYKKDILRGTMSVPSYKSDLPIDLHKKNIALECEKDENGTAEWFFTLKLFSNIGVKNFGLDKNSFRFKAVIRKETARSYYSILERCYDGEYEISGSQLKYENGKWYLMLCFSFERDVKAPVLDKERVMGVHIGERNAVTCTVADSKRKYVINGGEVEAFAAQVEHRRRNIGKASRKGSKLCGDGRVGHGYHSKMEPLEKIGAKVANFRNTTNHRYSRQIVDWAVQNNCGTIQIEDLTGYASAELERYKLLKNWSYFDLMSKIEYKAQEHGIDVKKIGYAALKRYCPDCKALTVEKSGAQNEEPQYISEPEREIVTSAETKEEVIALFLKAFSEKDEETLTAFGCGNYDKLFNDLCTALDNAGNLPENLDEVDLDPQLFEVYRFDNRVVEDWEVTYPLANGNFTFYIKFSDYDYTTQSFSMKSIDCRAQLDLSFLGLDGYRNAASSGEPIDGGGNIESVDIIPYLD